MNLRSVGPAGASFCASKYLAKLFPALRASSPKGVLFIMSLLAGNILASWTALEKSSGCIPLISDLIKSANFLVSSGLFKTSCNTVFALFLASEVCLGISSSKVPVQRPHVLTNQRSMVNESKLPLRLL